MSGEGKYLRVGHPLSCSLSQAFQLTYVWNLLRVFFIMLNYMNFIFNFLLPKATVRIIIQHFSFHIVINAECICMYVYMNVSFFPH